jgi:hypothetical protein
MTDREFDRLLAGRDLPVVPAVRVNQIKAAVTGDLKPVRPLAPEWAYVAAFAALFAAVCIASYYVLPAAGWRALGNLQRTLIFVPLCVAAGLLVFSVVRQMTPAAQYAHTTAAAAAGVFALLLALLPILFRPEQESGFLYDGLVCFRAGMLFAIPTALLFWLLLLRGARLSYSLTGATAGGLAGLTGLTVLEIHCPNLNVYHIVAAHISVALVCAAAGFFFSGVTFRRRMPK